jgi:hypothetical protein
MAIAAAHGTQLIIAINLVVRHQQRRCSHGNEAVEFLHKSRTYRNVSRSNIAGK